MLCANYGAGVIHLHNISGSREPLQDAMPRLGIPYGYTVHDLNFACPTVTLTRADGYFCGGVTDAAACTSCLAEQRLGAVDIARWRDRHAVLLAGASFVIAPSRFAADLLRRYFPAIDPVVIAHGLPAREPRRGGARQVVLMPDDGLVTVAVIGAVGPDKGSRRIERLAEHAARVGARVRFVRGRVYRPPSSRRGRATTHGCTVHGRYDPRDLPWLLDHYGAQLVVFPSLGPETFAFTLSEAWSAGRAVLVPPIGALAERVLETRAGWVMSDAEWRDDARLLDRIEALLDPARAEALAAAARSAAGVPLPTLAAMAAATVERYRSACAALPVSHPPVDRLRVVEAYGFRRWVPPKAGDATLSHTDAVARNPVLASSAAGRGDAAKRLRATAAGRVLYRPPPRGCARGTEVEDALMAEPAYADWLQRGRTHQWEGRPVDAMLCFQRAAAIAPDGVDARYLLGEVQWQVGAIAASVAAWRDAARVAPTHLASHLALAEAHLALGEPGLARDAAERALALAPDDAAALLLRAVAAFASDHDRGALKGVSVHVTGGPGRLASPAVGAALARALRAHPDARGALDLLAALVPHLGTVAFAMLAPMAHGAFAAAVPEALAGARAALRDAALARPLAPADVEVLRDIALAFARGYDLPIAIALAARYAQATVALAGPVAPAAWPARTSGEALRVAVLLPADPDAAVRATALLAEAARSTPAVEWTLVAYAGVPADLQRALPGAVVRVLAPGNEAAAAEALAASDPDLLLDLGGIGLPSGSLLVRRPAPLVVGAAIDLPAHAPPLVDLAVEPTAPGLASALAQAAARARLRPACAMTSTELVAMFARAVEAHRDGRTDEAERLYDALLAAQPEHAPTLHLAAGLAREQGRPEAAGALLQRALRAAPDFVDARAAAARLARDRGRIEDGLALVDEGLTAAPRSLALWRVRGELELARHDGAAARDAFEKALAARADRRRGALQLRGRAAEAPPRRRRGARVPAGVGVRPRLRRRPLQPRGAVPGRRARRAARSPPIGRCSRATRGTWRPTATWARCCSPPAASTTGSRTSAASRPRAPTRCRSPCRRSRSASTRRTTPRLERYLDGLRKERFRARDAAELADALEQLLYLLLFFDVEPEMMLRFAQTYDSTAPQVYGAALPRAAARRPGQAAHRLPVRGPAQPRDGQDDVAGGAPPRPRALRRALLFAVARARRLDRAVRRGGRPLRAARRTLRARGGRAHRGRRPRPARRPVRPHQGRASPASWR